MRRNLFLFFLLLVFAGRASADGMDLVTQSGVWGTACPPVYCSQTGDTWSYSFQTTGNLPGFFLGTPTSTVTNFEWYLNGVPVPALTVASEEAYWFPQTDDGGFAAGGIEFAMWDQLYAYAGCPACTLPTCPTCTPTLVPGIYNVDIGGGSGTGEIISNVDAGPFDETSFFPGPVVITEVPEPSALILIVTGLLVLAFIARRNSPNHRRRISIHRALKTSVVYLSSGRTLSRRSTVPRPCLDVEGSMRRNLFLFLLLLVFAGRASADGIGANCDTYGNPGPVLTDGQFQAIACNVAGIGAEVLIDGPAGLETFTFNIYGSPVDGFRSFYLNDQGEIVVSWQATGTDATFVAGYAGPSLVEVGTLGCDMCGPDVLPDGTIPSNGYAFLRLAPGPVFYDYPDEPNLADEPNI